MCFRRCLPHSRSSGYCSTGPAHSPIPKARLIEIPPAIPILAALGATYSLANGNLLWPLLVAAALFLRLRRSAVLSIAITGVVSTCVYFYHYVRPPYHADPIASLGAPSSSHEVCGRVLRQFLGKRIGLHCRSDRRSRIGRCPRMVLLQTTQLYPDISGLRAPACSYRCLLRRNSLHYRSGTNKFRGQGGIRRSISDNRTSLLVQFRAAAVGVCLLLRGIPIPFGRGSVMPSCGIRARCGSG